MCKGIILLRELQLNISEHKILNCFKCASWCRKTQIWPIGKYQITTSYIIIWLSEIMKELKIKRWRARKEFTSGTHEPLKVKRAIHWESWGRMVGKGHRERMNFENSRREVLQQNGLAWEAIRRNSKAF